MERIEVSRMDGLSAYKLSHLVSNLIFVKPNARGQLRPDKTKKAVLRALCDRYPNVWPSVKDIAEKASCSVSQVQRALRDLEHKDRLIVDISTDPGKKGGRGQGCTAQYFIRDRKIFDIVQQQKYWAEQTRSCEDEDQRCIPIPKPGHMRTETRSYENRNPVIPASLNPVNPVMVTDEPIIPLTDKVLTDNLKPITDTDGDTVVQQKDAAPVASNSEDQNQPLKQEGIDDAQKRVEEETKRVIKPSKSKTSSAPVAAAKEAFELFCQDDDADTALQMVLWTLYRAASSGQVPQTLAYYREANTNFIQQYDDGYYSVLEHAVERFNKHAHRFVKAQCPELLQWLYETYQTVAAERATAA
jgi:hypothetical protein